MEKKDDSTFKFTSVDLLVFAWDKRMQLIIVSFFAAVVSIILSFRITELYKSTVVLFPAPSTSVSKYLMTSQYAGTQGLLAFGEEEESEQLLQVLNSDEIRSRIIKKYDLLHHYDIKDNAKYKRTLLYKKYNSQINYKRTKYRSVIIEVLDHDPDTAALIANDIAAFVDTVINRIKRERALKALQLVEKEYYNLARQIQSAEDSLAALRRLGVFDYQSQSEVLSDAYARAITDRKYDAAKTIQNKLGILAKYGGPYYSINLSLEFEKEKLSDLKAKYAEAKVDAEEVLPQKYVVNSAFPAERKSYPKKSLIVLQSTLGTFIFAYIVLLLIHLILNRKKQEN